MGYDASRDYIPSKNGMSSSLVRSAPRAKAMVESL